MLTYATIFSGIGGWELGLNACGWELQWQCECDPFCRALLKERFGVPVYDDVRSLVTPPETPAPVDVLVGSPPCQPFSRAGQQNGVADDRHLYPNTSPMAKDFSVDRLGPMIRDTPCLSRKLGDEKSRNTARTILNKTFPGGNISITGANSPTGLRSKPKRIILLDEVDGYPLSSGREGDPIFLAVKRAANFWNRRIVAISTPTIKGLSRVEKLWEESDKRFYHIACPRCGGVHILKWLNIQWGADTPAKGDPRKAVFRCPLCFDFYTNAEKNLAVKNAPRILGCDPWIPSEPEKSPSEENPDGWAGFHMPEFYSPWRGIREIVNDWITSEGDLEQRQTIINTVFGECWVDGGEPLDEHALLKRCEPYGPALPDRVLILTAGIDTQPDRLEVEVVGWAGGEESWSVDYRVIEGNPDIPEGQPGSPWTALTDYLRRAWRHPLYGEMAIEGACIDTGGHNTQSVYAYVRRHKGENVFGVKGKGGEGIPIIGRPSRRGTGKKGRVPIPLYTVGTDQAKAVVYRRLRLKDPGPGYCHFPLGRPLVYFEQLTAEKVLTTYKKGFPHRVFELPKGKRNEALDTRVYAFAALVMKDIEWDKLAWRMKQRAKPLPMPPQPTAMNPEEAPQSENPEPKEPAPPASPSSEVVVVVDPDDETGAVETGRRKRQSRGGRRQRRSYANSW